MTGYYPEMNEARPADTQIDATMARFSDHYYLETPLTLKGRGIKHEGVLRADELVESARHKAGWNEYRVTEAAFRKLDAAYKISMEFLLD